MKQIDVFVNSVYQHVVGNRNEIQELKAEMKSHLLEAVHELKSQGKSEQYAIELAIQRFGGEQEMRSVVSQLFQAQKTFAKWVLYLAVAVLIFTATAVGIIWSIEEENANENSIVATQIFDMLHNTNQITEDMKLEINRLIKGTDQISKVELYNVRNVDNPNLVFDYVRDAKPDYRYEQKVWNPTWLQADFFPYGNGDSEWYVNMETRHIGSLMTIILFAGMAIYWTLFTIWATVNAYHNKRLTIGWILVFAFFNWVGYVGYFLVGKRTKEINV
ncbi:PLD nuclease N-terminal domain-containing protein [Robertmurraya korlensis]|uniref:permease prefix domain 1-containing protein n=1 Tax=Robertmurraya korlensis TaxID=519977 RepID=UPI002041C6AC|nr:permease prefix domain 1-containing protein [Robertmurraya korlensis]MCM3601164.1 PLD nuclease N-terminal domain-containing protein [Robertmurraya korlensis]